MHGRGSSFYLNKEAWLTPLIGISHSFRRCDWLIWKKEAKKCRPKPLFHQTSSKADLELVLNLAPVLCFYIIKEAVRKKHSSVAGCEERISSLWRLHAYMDGNHKHQCCRENKDLFTGIKWHGYPASSSPRKKKTGPLTVLWLDQLLTSSSSSQASDLELTCGKAAIRTVTCHLYRSFKKLSCVKWIISHT